jgi:Mg2+/Co2+ transporter CorB
VGIEWFRDLSVTILCFVTTAVIILIAILIFLLYRKAKSALQLAESAAKKAYDTVTIIQEFIKPLLPIISLIQGICGGLGGISKIFSKGNNEGGNNDE